VSIVERTLSPSVLNECPSKVPSTSRNSTFFRIRLCGIQTSGCIFWESRTQIASFHVFFAEGVGRHGADRTSKTWHTSWLSWLANLHFEADDDYAYG